MIILGLVLAGAMGILLGMLGGGGSILTVPILVYVLGVPQDSAPSYSLLVVGVASLIGSVQYIRQRQFSLPASMIYGIPSMLAVFFNQAFLRPWIPDQLLILGHLISKGTLLMVLFAVMMLLAAWSLIRKKSRKKPNAVNVDGSPGLEPMKIVAAGLAEGMLTGLVGAGGGFIIVPALVTVAKLPMRIAVGTSLIVMAVKSLVGFTGALHDLKVDWTLLAPFTAIAVVGILFGARFSRKVPAARLKQLLGWFILVMGTFIVMKTIWDAQR